LIQEQNITPRQDEHASPAVNKQAKDTWDSSTGLDSLIKSISGTDLSTAAPTPASFISPIPVSVALTPSPEVDSTDALVVEEDEDVREETEELDKALASSSQSTIPHGALKINLCSETPISDSLKPVTTFRASGMMKKPSSSTTRKTSVAKKLTTPTASKADITIESFEATDRRLAAAAKLNEAKAAAADSNTTSLGSSGVAAAYAETIAQEDSAPSIYRSVPLTATTSAKALNGKGATTSTISGNESFLAREKYGKAKAISSDQFFSDPSADSQDRVLRDRLEGLAGSTSISSEMLYSENSNEGSGRGRDSYYNRSSDPWTPAGPSGTSSMTVASLGRWTQDLMKNIGSS
jgi:hypothetical protein